MKTLLVLRHAKSSWSDSSLDDHERPLNKRGERDAPRMGQLVREHQLAPHLIISSDAVRARMTAEAVATAVGADSTIRLEPRLYAAGPAAILTVLREVADTGDAPLMIVAHNPGLEELVTQLTGEAREMPTAGLAQVVLSIDRWADLEASTRGSLLGFWRPKELT